MPSDLGEGLANELLACDSLQNAYTSLVRIVSQFESKRKRFPAFIAVLQLVNETKRAAVAFHPSAARFIWFGLESGRPND